MSSRTPPPRPAPSTLSHSQSCNPLFSRCRFDDVETILSAGVSQPCSSCVQEVKPDVRPLPPASTLLSLLSSLSLSAVVLLICLSSFPPTLLASLPSSRILQLGPRPGCWSPASPPGARGRSGTRTSSAACCSRRLHPRPPSRTSTSTPRPTWGRARGGFSAR